LLFVTGDNGSQRGMDMLVAAYRDIFPIETGHASDDAASLLDDELPALDSPRMQAKQYQSVGAASRQ
jgi:hypothetical protein